MAVGVCVEYLRIHPLFALTSRVFAAAAALCLALFLHLACCHTFCYGACCCECRCKEAGEAARGSAREDTLISFQYFSQRKVRSGHIISNFRPQRAGHKADKLGRTKSMHEAMRQTLAMSKSEVRRRDPAPTTTACFTSRRRRRRLLHKVATRSSSAAAACCGILLILLPTAITRVAALTEITNVAAPTSNLTAGTYHAVGWVYSTDTGAWGTTGDLRPFEIELRSCGADASQEADCGLGDGCGNPYLSLCDLETGAACMDSDGSYDVLIPEDVDAGMYVFSVTHLGLSSWTSGTSSMSDVGLVTGCSQSFFVEAAVEKDALTAEAPAASFLQPGDAFTAEWEYEGEDGETDGSFEVNLFSCADQACEQDRWVLRVPPPAPLKSVKHVLFCSRSAVSLSITNNTSKRSWLYLLSTGCVLYGFWVVRDFAIRNSSTALMLRALHVSIYAGFRYRF